MTSQDAKMQPVRRRGPSMADVARVAGVSGQTVSRVSNGRSNVDDETRSRVLAAMRKVGYRPNSAARALRSGRFRNIGVIMFTLSSFGNTRTLDGIAQAAVAAGYSMALIPVNEPTQEAMSLAFTRLHDQGVDGVIIVSETHRLNSAALELPVDLPVIMVDSGTRANYPVVDTDQTEGARLATEHLLGLGHETVWHISGPASSYSAERRRLSWINTLIKYGRTVPPVLQGDWSADSGYQAGLILAQNPQATAIFASNDGMALGALRALHESGRTVPDQISVVGFDDMAESGNFCPPLTTIHQHFEDVGRNCVSLIVRSIQQGVNHQAMDLSTHTAENVQVPTRLVVRASTAPPPS